jgi:O-antigen ligase
MAAAIAEETTDLEVRAVRRVRRRANRTAKNAVKLARVIPRAAPGWEWAIIVLVLFMLARSPLLFYRRRIAELVGGRVFYVWQDDGVIRAATAAALLVVYVIAARRCDPRNLLRHPYLLALLALTLASASWSVEPTVSLWRSTFFLGTAVIGWYLGERFSMREQIGIVGASSALGAVASIVALVAWPEIARGMSRPNGAWSGAYVNRNWLGLIMSLGLLSAPFLWATVRRRRRILVLAVSALEGLLLLKSGSRTGVVALAAAGTIGLVLLMARRLELKPLGPSVGGVAVALIVGYLGLVVYWNWAAIVHLLGRGPRLSGRSELWQIDLVFSAQRPWTGWGFEAIWAHPPTISEATAVFGRFPYAAHSGFYEILLGVGSAGLIVFILFIAVAGWRAFRFAWEGSSVTSLWPLVFIVFAVVANISESLFVSSESMWALTVAAAVAATRTGGRRRAIS